MKAVLEQVKGIRVRKDSESSSPHKFVLLLALAKLYHANPQRANKFPIDSELESAFISSWGYLAPNHKEELAQIEHPYFHLRNDGFWHLKLKPGQEATFANYLNSANMRLTRKRLIETVDYAWLSDDFDAVLRDEEKRECFCAFVEGIVEQHNTGIAELHDAPVFQRLKLSPSEKSACSPFVRYLNSLQRLNASNENALAEFQACSPFFAHLHVPHPLVETFWHELNTPGGRQIILTGHAGDGKSTIALELFKRIAKISADQPLKQQLKPREDLPKTNISIIKDLSERRRSDDPALVAELFGGKRRFLLVSNTGTLLDLFQGQRNTLKLSKTELEDRILRAISNEQGLAECVLGNTKFLVANLARMDNLGLGRQIFARMVDLRRWEACGTCPSRTNCPVCLNVELINHCRETVFGRLFLAYRRMYEYGTRLTLRQLTEHLAYLVTSGLEERDLAGMRKRGEAPLKAEFMFFNRFFGDTGKKDDPGALCMRAVREVRKQGFGERPCPTWERKLWLKTRDRHFHLGVTDCDAEFELLRQYGSGSENDRQSGLTPDQAREQVRRMLYFLYDFQRTEQSYLKQFLNSSYALRWQEWQEPGARLEPQEKSLLEQRVYHVLQEHFTGVRLPEGNTSGDRRLYITLNRGKSEVRQSAQVVLADVDWSNEIALTLRLPPAGAVSPRTDLVLQGNGRIAEAELVLTLPFLDYVVMRHFGEVGEVLQAAYVERLERFKAQVQRLARTSQTDVMLVRLRTDHTFRRQKYSICSGKLEVNNA